MDLDLNVSSEDLFGLFTDGGDRNHFVSQNEALPMGDNVDNDNGCDDDGAPVEDEGSDDLNLKEHGIQFSREELEVGPQSGMIFSSIDDLYSFYKAHAKVKGFSITKRSLVKRGGENIKYAHITCDRGRDACGAKSTKRIKCSARVNVVLKSDGSWVVGKVVHEHTHELDPDMSRLMPGHRFLTNAVKRRLEANDRAGLRISKSIRLEEVQSGGPEQMTCLPQDCRNFINNNRALRMEDGDAESIRKFFSDMQRKDRDFFHLMDVDSAGRLRNVVWVHPHCKAAYQEFHDVVCFDTTYLLNKYRMPFATFVGVNHHCQSILLGCALISHENVETFRWLFSTWVSAMDDIYPNGILTDQCESIKAAIRYEMPNTVHRFCIWHILTKLPARLRNVVANYRTAKEEFHALIFDSLTVEEFEARWESFLANHQLQTNEWLAKLYGEREKWVPVYLKDFFWAGMKSTQRSEGMHAFFDGYVNSRSSLSSFVEQYEVALRHKHEKELLAEHKSRYKIVVCESGFEWESQLADSLTPSVFKLVRKEMIRLYHCEITNIEPILGIGGVYCIMDRSIRTDFYGNEYTYIVEYGRNGNYFKCNCKMFESQGVLCCHILKVIVQNRISRIDERYIPRRWRKDVHRTHLKKFLSAGYPHMSEEYKAYKYLLNCFESVTDIAMDDMRKMGYVKSKLLSLKHDLLNWNENMSVPYVEEEEVQARTENVDVVLDPKAVRSRGRARVNRYMSGFEINNSGRGRGTNAGRGRGATQGRGNVPGGRIG